MDTPIRTINDLRMEISRLKGLEAEQTIAIGKRFNSLSAIFSTIVSLFPKSTTAADGEKSPGFFDQDIVGLLSRFVLPFALNKTIFRHSNFVVKALVGLVSQKASHFITEESVAALWEKVITLFKSKSADIPEHRAIPALSETY